jgi:rubrerythrin
VFALNLIKALEAAIAEEKEATEKYKIQAEQAEDPESRLLFSQLAREEESHYRRLVERLKALRAL